MFIEAKQLNNPLTSVKSITQIVGYAANAGVEWCILTNGITYKVYSSTKKAKAPDKLLFEVSIDPRETEGMTIQQVAEQFARFSREAMAKGELDEIGEQIFTTGKIRKALDKLFMDPPNKLIRLIRSTIGDDTVRPMQIREAIKRLWAQTSGSEIPSTFGSEAILSKKNKTGNREYSEKHLIEGKPKEIIELFWTVDKFCRELSPIDVQRKYLDKYVKYTFDSNIFCCIRPQKSGLRIWLKLNYSDLENPPEYVRDVQNIGHWGVGNVELIIDNIQRFQHTKNLIIKSFENSKLK